MKRILQHPGAFLLMIGLLLLLATALLGTGGRYPASPHGSATDGVWRTNEAPRGSCAQCHDAHEVVNPQSFGLFRENSNELCFGASLGGCHADRPTGATSGYPAQESDRLPLASDDPGYFEYANGGVRIPGLANQVRWPGRSTWRDAAHSPHMADADMPIKDAFGEGSCDNCHDVHGGISQRDMLDTAYAGIVNSQSGSLPANYDLCLRCHSYFGPVGMDEASKKIASYYDRSLNPRNQAGHGISAGGGYVSVGARLPCYDCHNPHGSEGHNGLGANAFLLSDQRPGWYELTDIKNDFEQARRFCFGCHPSSDNIGGGQVEGMTPSPLPASVDAHRAAATVHCYDCHGRDYSSQTSFNVHNPHPGGDCLSCHAVAQGPRRAVTSEFQQTAHHVFPVGQTGTLSKFDCGVCHMEGSTLTGDPEAFYHANGTIELRNPDNGGALAPFLSLQRDTLSSILEPAVAEVQNNFCLKCHDADGALSPLARVSSGTAAQPFGRGGIVIDVATQFSPLNGSTHPVLTRGDNQYTVPGPSTNFTRTMLPPFNQTATHDLISCFDCHTANGHGAANSGMLYVETYFRDPSPTPQFASGQREFCSRCHDPETYLREGERSRFAEHSKGAHVHGLGTSVNTMSCRGCHAGVYEQDAMPSCDNGSGIGTIHGSPFAYQNCSPTPGATPQAFLFGGYLKGWGQGNAQQNTCYANCHHATGEDY